MERVDAGVYRMGAPIDGEFRISFPAELYINTPVGEAVVDIASREAAGSVLVAWDEPARFVARDLLESLQAAGVLVEEYRVDAPCRRGLGYPLGEARRLASRIAESGAELVVGLGSGCLLSLVKVAWLLRHRPTLEPGRILPAASLGVRGSKPRLVAAPVGGAGREVDSAAVLEDSGRAVVVVTPEIVPSYAVVDTALSLPGPSRRGLLDLLADSVVHAFDSMTSALANPISEALSHLAIRRLHTIAVESGDRLAEPSAQPWAMIASISLLSSLASSTASVSLTCSLAIAAQEALGLTEHGLVAASFLPVVIRYYQTRPPASERLARLALELARVNGMRGPPEPSIQAARLLELIGVPGGLEHLGVQRDALESKAEEIAARALELAPGRLAVERPSLEELREMVVRAYNWEWLAPG